MMSYDVIVIGAGVVGSAGIIPLPVEDCGAGEGAGCGVRKQQPQYRHAPRRIYL